MVQPWKCLKTFNVSKNEIKCLDQSLKLLPCLEEVYLMYSNNLVHSAMTTARCQP